MTPGSGGTEWRPARQPPPKKGLPIVERDAEAKALARSCMRKDPGHTRLVFVHARKAGGTTTRQWLALKQCDHGPHRGGAKFSGFLSEGEIVNVTRLAEPATIWLTTLREPVSRVISSYFFEGRWPKVNVHQPRDAHPWPQWSPLLISSLTVAI